MVIIEQKTLIDQLGVDVMAQLKASLLEARGREDGARVYQVAYGTRSLRRCGFNQMQGPCG